MFFKFLNHLERESLALAPNQSKLLTNIGELERNRDKRRNQQVTLFSYTVALINGAYNCHVI